MIFFIFRPGFLFHFGKTCGYQPYSDVFYWYTYFCIIEGVSNKFLISSIIALAITGWPRYQCCQCQISAKRDLSVPANEYQCRFFFIALLS